MPDFKRLDEILWDAWYMRLYRYAVEAGHPEQHAHERSSNFIRMMRNICTGACMSDAEWSEEQRRFDKEAAEVERELAGYAEEAELERRQETYRYWNEVYGDHA